MLFAGATASSAFLVTAATPAAAQGQVSAEFGAWVLWCEQQAGAQTEQCALLQRVIAEDRDDIALDVVVLRTADQQVDILRVVAPLGVLLPAGLGLKIDEVDVGRIGFVRCRIDLGGCVAEVVMDEELIADLHAGTTAIFTVFQTPEEGVGIPISLDGFDEGFAALR